MKRGPKGGKKMGDFNQNGRHEPKFMDETYGRSGLAGCLVEMGAGRLGEAVWRASAQT